MVLLKVRIILSKLISAFFSQVTVSSSQDNSVTQTQTVQPQKTFAESGVNFTLTFHFKVLFIFRKYF